MTAIALPVVAESSLSQYLEEIKRFPMLEKEEEYLLAKAWVERGDTEAAHKLVTSHLRLVAKIAMGFRGYGLPLVELISEGNIGLMQAVKRFDPEKGFRLSTYAMWWIKAAIQEFILRSWSLVKMGTTAAQKKLFFNLRRLRNSISKSEVGDLSPDEVAVIANELEVPEQDVVEMDRRLNGSDYSLNATFSEENDGEWIDYLEDEDANQEHWVAENQEITQKRALLATAMGQLNAREQDIITARRLQENPTTLEELSQKYGVSRERVRQIEARAMEKLQESVLADHAAASAA